VAYIIVSEEAEDFQLDVAQFAVQLRNTWTDIEFVNFNIPRTFAVLSWRFKADNDSLSGDLYNDKLTVSIDCSELGVATFSIWYRTVVLTKYRLFLCHDEWAELEFELTEASTIEQVLQVLGYS
jgi:hypothetical protein